LVRLVAEIEAVLPEPELAPELPELEAGLDDEPDGLLLLLLQPVMRRAAALATAETVMSAPFDVHPARRTAGIMSTSRPVDIWSL
jgi:hypothetical protein